MSAKASSSLASRALTGTVVFVIIVWLLIFLPAGTLRYWQGWLFWLNYCGWSAGITWYFLKHDPSLIERRLRSGPTAEREPSQKIIQLIAGLLFFALFIVCALDYRFRWSSVGWSEVVAGNIIVAVGLAGFWRVFRENSFASAIIEVGAGQKVISTGPYALVRHPMYTAGLLQFAATPLALASHWGLLVVVPLTGIIVARLLDEERFLTRQLPGYAEYCAKVRYRLVPGVW